MKNDLAHHAGSHRGSVSKPSIVPAGLVVGGLTLFVLIAVAVHLGWLDEADRWILLSLRNETDLGQPVGWERFPGIVRDVTALGSFAVLASTVIAVAGFMVVVGRWDRALALVTYAAGGALVGEATKHLFARARPEVVPHLVEVVTLSFPSAHAMQSASIWFILAMFLAKMQWEASARFYLFGVAAVLTFMVGASRAYLGVHWPSDLVAGWSLGAAWIGTCALLDRQRGRLMH